MHVRQVPGSTASGIVPPMRILLAPLSIFIPALFPLAACSLLPDTLNYGGTLRPVSGTCDPPTEAVLTIRKADIIFAPASGTLLLRGRITGNALSAGLALTDPNKHPYQLAFQGTRMGTQIAGTYSTPRCRYAVTLHLTGD